MISNNPRLASFLEHYGIVVIVVVMMVVLYVSRPDVFLSLANLTNIIKQNATLALLALGMFVVIVTAGIDLSVGSVMALGMMCLAVAAKAGRALADRHPDRAGRSASPAAWSTGWGSPCCACRIPSS